MAVDVVGAGYTLALITAHIKGIVIYARYNSVLGYHVNIQLENSDMMQYYHMTSALQVKTEDNVKEGQIIGTMGSTGSSTGAHLHFGIQHNGEWINPEPYLYTDYLEEEMTGEEIYNALDEYIASLSTPEWAEEELNEAIEAGITDCTNLIGLIL